MRRPEPRIDVAEVARLTGLSAHTNGLKPAPAARDEAELISKGERT